MEKETDCPNCIKYKEKNIQLIKMNNNLQKIVKDFRRKTKEICNEN